MEFVKVIFGVSRTVNIDGAPRGMTGQRLRLGPGTHSFDLGTPVDYRPSSITKPILGTTPDSPEVILFAPLAGIADIGGGPPPGVAGARKSAGPKKGPGPKKVAGRKKSAGRKKARAAKKRTTARRKPRPRARAPRPAARNKRR